MANIKGGMPLPETAESPAKSAEIVTPADGSDLPNGPCKSIYVGAAGNINLDTFSGETVLFQGLVAGSILPVQARRIRSTNTTVTAGNIIALYQ